GSVGEQPHTGYNTQALHGSLQYLLSNEKTVSASLQSVNEQDFWRAWQIADGSHIQYLDGPAKLKLATISYQDLADHGVADSINATAYFNRQNDGRSEIRVASPGTQNFGSESDNLFGLNLGLGTFIGQSHHILYGLDATTETVHADAHDLNLATGASTEVRGR